MLGKGWSKIMPLVNWAASYWHVLLALEAGVVPR